MNKYDLVVIGWGKGGKTLAKEVANAGLKVAIIEKDPKMYGGTCINVGCLPSKSLIHSAKVLQQVQKLGVERNWEFNQNTFKEAMKHKREFVKFLNQKNYELLANNKNCDVYLGEASFVDSHNIKIVNHQNEEVVISAEKIVINTGSTPRVPNFIPGAVDSPRVLSSKEILDLDQLPKTMLVVGAGFIGLEFASYYSNFGTKVTVIQHNNDFLPSEDDDDANVVLETLKNQGINFIFKAQIKSFIDQGDKVIVEYTYENANHVNEYDVVLMSIGRIPNIQGLDLEKAGVEVENNAIKVDLKLRTTAQHIFACGDVKGGAFFTYVSLDDSRIILPQILDLDSSRDLSDRTWLPTSTFIDPTYSRTGYNEKQAQKMSLKYSIKRISTLQIPKAYVIDEKKGFMKLLIDENDCIIGATIFNYESAEMINLISLAIKYQIKYNDLKNFIYTHPTFTESLNEI